jgi:hypothetical protein
MCLRLNAAGIAVPLGDRPDLPAFSAARLGEGQRHGSSSSIRFAVHPAPLAIDRSSLEAGGLDDETEAIEQAITRFDTHPKESIMSLQTVFTAAVLTLSAVAAQAAPQVTAKLERVVITGKAVRADTQVVAQLPRVVVTGYAVRQVAQLPRVVVTGYSEATLLRQATLAAAKTGTKRI